MRTKKTSIIAPILLVFIGAILIVSAIAYLIGYSFQTNSATPVAAANQAVPLPEVQRISLKDARAAFELGSAVFLDVRGTEYYQQGHIPGAMSIPEEELPTRLDELDPNSWIITYCT
jgi:3-mercaptopyruvate sulfurtransferase SseA